ncbi:ABC transporter ATP-binding protein [Candidatus Omnitrophota bacterium]
MKNYLKLLKFLKGHRKLFSFAVVAMLFGSIFEIFQLSMAVPFMDRMLTNTTSALPNQLPKFLADLLAKFNEVSPDTMYKYFPIVFLGGMLLKHVITFIYQYLMNLLSQRVMRDIRNKLFDHIQNLSLDYFSKKRTGELVSRITNDVNVVENAVSYGLIDLFRQTFMIIMYVFTAFFIHPKAALIIFCVFPFIGFPMSKIGRRLKKLSQGTQEKMADINSHLLETISGIKLVKVFCNEKYEVERFKSFNYDYFKLRIKSIKRLLAISPISELFGAICAVTVLLWLGRDVLEGEMSVGFFSMFLGAIMSIISPVKKLGNVNALIQQALSANERIYAVLDSVPSVQEKEGAIALGELSEVIKYDHVDFHYDEESDIVLTDINFEVKKGELVAIVGPTGTGKSTLVNLIPRFYDPCKGVVTIDGVNLKDVTFKSLRDQIGVVTQEMILFNDTVKYNIAYGHQEATDAQIEEAAKKAFAHRFIEKMPDGYNTVIGDRGFRLSGGEKQRLAIARAILSNPSLLILDEATSQLDSESEKFVQEALDKLMQGRTVIAIAHRLSTVRKADKIIVIDRGGIVGMGRHEVLLDSCPLYAKLHSMQFNI